MVRGKKHTAEQIVNLLRQVEVGELTFRARVQRRFFDQAVMIANDKHAVASPNRGRKDLRRSGYSVYNIRTQDCLKVMIPEARTDSALEFLRLDGIHQKLSRRRRSTHANSRDDDLYLARCVIMDACNDRVIAIDGPVLQLKIETPIPLRRILRI